MNNPRWESELQALKEIIGKTELIETVKWGAPVYTINGKNVIGLGGFKNYFTIWFYNGVFLTDPKKVLVNAGQGVTKALRQWRFSSSSELDEKLILAYLSEAIANAHAGKVLKAQARSKNFTMPDLLAKALEESGLTQAFFKFTPGKQYEFVEHIDSAKLEKTKLSRIEKILPMIDKGVGLNDKYR